MSTKLAVKERFSGFFASEKYGRMQEEDQQQDTFGNRKRNCMIFARHPRAGEQQDLEEGEQQAIEFTRNNDVLKTEKRELVRLVAEGRWFVAPYFRAASFQQNISPMPIAPPSLDLPVSSTQLAQLLQRAPQPLDQAVAAPVSATQVSLSDSQLQSLRKS